MNVLWEYLLGIINSLRFWRVIQPNEAGVRTTRGLMPRALGPGLHMVWPIIGRIEVVEVAEQPLDVRSQSLTTLDGVPAGAGCSLVYVIDDVLKAVIGTRNVDDSLRCEALGLMDEYVSGRDFAKCVDTAAFRKWIRTRLRTQAKARWGVDVLGVYRTDFARARSFRIMKEGGEV